MTTNGKRELGPDVVKTSEVIGVSVKNNEKENIGEINEIVVDKLNGNIRYVVLSFGGFLGLGDKLFAVPWNALHYNAEEKCFMLNIAKEKLQQAPSFDKNNWPNLSDNTMGERVYNYYDSKPNWK